jgi:hypothetical protein
VEGARRFGLRKVAKACPPLAGCARRAELVLTAPSGIITLLSDFGIRDPFVAMVKGVILERFPAARMVDITHSIPPQDLRVASFWLAKSYRWFPKGTVHFAVVDPGVGTERERLALDADGHWFVAPDNGLCTTVIGCALQWEARRIELSKVGAVNPSRTFEGRDVFGPAAAELASGRLAFSEIGPLTEPVLFSEAATPRGPDSDSGLVSGRVVCADRFGNLITDIDATRLDLRRQYRVLVGGRQLGLFETYSGVRSGELLALVNSLGTIEIACRDGNAAKVLELEPGAPIQVSVSSPESRFEPGTEPSGRSS